MYKQVSESKGYSPSFFAYRCILIKPRDIAAIVEKLRAEFPNARVEFVDLRTYFRLLKEKLVNPLASPWRDAEEVIATPEKAQGLLITPSSGGYFTTTTALYTAAWSVTTQDHGLYMYYNVDDAFAQQNANCPMEVEVTFLDDGTGRVQLQYDSLDRSAPLDGSYKNATPDLELTNSGTWRTVTFLVSDARFSNRQNGGSDFRLCKAPNDRLVIRDVKVRVPNPM